MNFPAALLSFLLFVFALLIFPAQSLLCEYGPVWMQSIEVEMRMSAIGLLAVTLVGSLLMLVASVVVEST